MYREKGNFSEMKVLFRIWLALSFVGMILLLFWIKSVIPTDEEELNSAVNAYRMKEYNGVVIDKFIDRDEHNFKKIIVNEDNMKKTLLFNIETSGIFDYFEVGDSIIKRNGSLQVRVLRHDLDTVLKMEFVESD